MASRDAGGRGTPSHVVTLGFTDLMTSLAVIFVLLMVVFANAARPPERHTQPVPAEAPPSEAADVVPPEPPIDVPAVIDLAQAGHVQEALEHSSPDGVALEADSHDPQVLRVIIPDAVLTFESGKSDLGPDADRLLAEVATSYAALLCGELRAQVAAVVIEGHTDDLGGDALNLRLSQERSLQVLVRGLAAIHDAVPVHYDCFSALASASGRGKQDLVYDENREPDRERSRRVVFKILLRSAAPRA